MKKQKTVIKFIDSGTADFDDPSNFEDNLKFNVCGKMWNASEI